MFHDSATTAHIATIRRALHAIGATLPKPVLKALEEHDKIKAAARAFTPATRGDVADAVAACLLADRDPLDDETVRRLVTSHALNQNAASGFGIDLTAQAHARVAKALTVQAEAIISLLAPHAETAGEDLARAYELLGDEDDPQQIMSRGVEAVEAWTRARKARDLLNVIDSAWSALAHLTGFASATTYPTFRLTDADPEVYDKAGRRADAEAIVRAGGRISLADGQTFAERCASYVDEVEQQQRKPTPTAVR